MMEAFDADVQLLPLWVQYFMNWIGLVLVVSTIIFLIFKSTRLAGLYQLVATIVGVAIMVWMHSQLGMVRLLGIVHIVFWPPLILYFWRNLKQGGLHRVVQIAMVVTLATMAVALLFDVADLVRWIAGERAPYVGLGPTG